MRFVSCFLALIFLYLQPALAQTAAPADDPRVAALQQAATLGPATVHLRDEATLNLPDGYVFLPSPQVDFVVEQMGNVVDSRFIGMIVSRGSEDWSFYVEYLPDGHVADGDAGKLDPAALLSSLQEGTEAANQRRAEQGIPALGIVGWIEPPAYDASRHQLSWSLEAQEQGHEAEEHTVNYNLKSLGREGMLSLTFVTGRSMIAAQKPLADNMLKAISFNPGRRYEDYNASTDKLAAYGLAAIITGAVAKKAGLLAMAGLLLAKAGKVIAVSVLGVIALIRRKLSRRNEPPAPPT